MLQSQSGCLIIQHLLAFPADSTKCKSNFVGALFRNCHKVNRLKSDGASKAVVQLLWKNYNIYVKKK
jgi:hypothetical protein